MSGKPQSKAEVLQGTLDLLVLQTLDSLGPLHGYAIAARFEQVSGGALQRNMGSLYPAGRRQLAREKDAWDRMAGIIHARLHGET
jgi:hypothetical protein